MLDCAGYTVSGHHHVPFVSYAEGIVCGYSGPLHESSRFGYGHAGDLLCQVIDSSLLAGDRLWAHFSKSPGMAHWKAVKHLFRYIKGTLDYKLTYSPSSSDELFTSYTDADHAGCPDTGRSTSGYVIKMGTAVSAGQEVLWLQNLLTEFGFDVSAASRLRIDNLSALSVAKNPEHHGRMKHLDLRFYWLRDEVAKGRIAIEHLRTSDMPADILTKSLAKPKVLEMVKMLGLGT
ncbi:hypothetical protein NUW54_g10750 [Trametes sanguinea]|uniref:Uncharacterized protein n=1 Tax=Trametes sanguinea TaxID=158606 RepID=A0ACC1NUL2_9APHY|nr:hypothetical protein NUW54_g10750 [Trametes sanguinea]